MSQTVLYMCARVSCILLCDLRSDRVTPAAFGTAASFSLCRISVHALCACVCAHTQYNVLFLQILLYNYIHMLISTA